MSSARDSALNVLRRTQRGAFSDKALHQALREDRLSARDQALCTRLVMGVIQNREYLDFILSGLSTVPLSKLESAVQNILRLGLYQHFLLDKVPGYALVSESVELAKRAGAPRAAGYVNAVMRRAVTMEHPPEPAGETARRLSVRYSQPEWQVTTHMDRLGEAEAEQLLRANNEIPPVWIRVNTIKTDTDTLMRALEEQEAVPRRHPALPDCLSLGHAAGLSEWDCFRNGHFFVADPAAQCAVAAADPKPCMRVLDGCAAPGGKSFLTALHMKNKGEILAVDRAARKLEPLEESAERLGLSIIRAATCDACELPESLGLFDLVIADVPCSGLGVLRKKPDIRDKSLAEVTPLPIVQTRILASLSSFVRPGGKLLYVTCTLRREENEEVVDAFRERHPRFMPLAFSTPLLDAPDGRLTLWPHRHGTDGFFIALFQRDEM